MATTTDLGTILGVWAHPDDEAYLSAGLMAAAREAGQRVFVLFATAGEAGTDDPVGWPRVRLARLRRRELAASLAALGVTEHHVADHGDGRCAEVGDARGAAWVGSWVDRVRPDTVLTFGPDGMTGHPDHLAVSRWVGEALAARPSRPRLLHATLTPGFHATWGATNDELGVWGGEPPCTEDGDLAVAFDCDDRLLDRKVAALRAHRSQTAALEALLGADRYRRWWARECFVEAVPVAAAPPPRPCRPVVGQRARRTREVTTRDIERFTELTGDRNPVHYDAELAAASRFGGIIVQGGVTSGLLNAVVAEQLPGPGSVFLETRWAYRAPVRPGDAITAEVEVLEARPDKPITRLRTTITTQSGTVVLDGEALVWRDPTVAAATG